MNGLENRGILMKEGAMQSLFEKLGGTCTLGKDDMCYPNLMVEEAD